jgi:type I restriction enzyme S subunit
MPERKEGVVPRLRFPEFRDAGPWEVKRLGDKDVALFVRDTATRKDLCVETYVSTENMLPDFGGVTRATSLPPSGTIRKYQKRDILIANIRPYLKKVWQADKAGAASNDVLVVRPSNTVDPRFLGLVLANDAFISFVMAGAKGVKMPRGDITLIKQFPIPIPVQRKEQQRIADCLSSLDEVIELEAQKLEALKTHKKGLMQLLFPREGETTPRLRFPEFRNAGEWEMKRLGECLEYQQPTFFLVSDTNYSNSYNIPVLTAGKTFLLGYTNEKNGVFREPLPVIIFDDFTTATKFVDFPFKVKSSALKILQAREGINIRFIYELMQMISYKVGAHERHWISKFQPMFLPVPQSKEQQKIADCLSSLDEVINLEAKKLEALKTHKKGLMQQLFPQEVD